MTAEENVGGARGRSLKRILSHPDEVSDAQLPRGASGFLSPAAETQQDAPPDAFSHARHIAVLMDVGDARGATEAVNALIASQPPFLLAQRGAVVLHGGGAYWSQARVGCDATETKERRGVIAASG